MKFFHLLCVCNIQSASLHISDKQNVVADTIPFRAIKLMHGSITVIALLREVTSTRVIQPMLTEPKYEKYFSGKK